MSKYKTIDVWNRVFGAKQEAYDYTGRLMKKSAVGIRTALITRRSTTSARFPPAAVMFLKTLSFAIVIPTRKKQITSRTGKRTEHTTTPAESKAPVWNTRLLKIEEANLCVSISSIMTTAISRIPFPIIWQLTPTAIC